MSDNIISIKSTYYL